jgi:hypothetical protein
MKNEKDKTHCVNKNIKIMMTLSHFLSGHRTSDKATHLSMVQPCAKYYVHGEDIDTFMDLYCTESPDSVLGLLEATSIYSTLPVLVDADIKKDFKDGDCVEPLYSSAFIQKLVSVYQKVLRAIIDQVPDEDLLCVVLEKKPYITDKNEKTGKTYI